MTTLTRMIVRSWVTGTLADTATHITTYFHDSAVARPRRSDRPWAPLWLLAKAAGVRRASRGTVVTDAPPGAHSALIAAALTGTAPPASLLSAAVMRSRAEITLVGSDNPDDRSAWRSREHARVCLARLILTRNPHLNGAFTVPAPLLDLDNTDPAYLCGRLFAEYEGLQVQAMGRDVNATITDRTYAKAMTSPLTVYPALDRLAKAHLRKLRTRNKDAAAYAIDRKITALVTSIGPIPASLTVPAQARWMLGYYQQRGANMTAAQAASPDNPGDTEPRDGVLPTDQSR